MPGAINRPQAVPPIVVRALCWAYADDWDTEPAYLCALAYVESSKGDLEFRTWKTGDYYQPMGLQYEQYGKFAKMGLYLDNLRDNIKIGAMALKGIHTMSALKARLRNYNSNFDKDPSYWRSICQAIKKYEKGVSL